MNARDFAILAASLRRIHAEVFNGDGLTEIRHPDDMHRELVVELARDLLASYGSPLFNVHQFITSARPEEASYNFSSQPH